MSELWGIYEGLRLYREQSLNLIEFHVDLVVTLSYFKVCVIGRDQGCTLIMIIKILLNGD